MILISKSDLPMETESGRSRQGLGELWPCMIHIFLSSRMLFLFSLCISIFNSF